MKPDQIQVEKRLVSDPNDDSRHVLRQDPVARESLPYMIVLPEEKLTAFAYTWVTPDSRAGAACCVFGPGIGEDPIFEKIDGIEVPRDMDFNDWRVGGMRVRQGDRLKVADMTFTGKRVAIDLHFEGFHPPYNYGGHPQGCPGFVADNRFEQSGLISGSLTVDGRRIPFHTTGHRDHSWGARDWGAIQHWKWLQGQAGPDLSVHMFDILVAGKTYIRGYIYKDRKMTEVTSVDFDFEHDAVLAPVTMTAVLRDDAGRSVNIRGRKIASYPFLIGPQTVNIQSGMSYEFDGVPGVGWLELSWPKAYLEYMSSRNA
jgi:hypothetical protein